jgi:hypothetical protein
MVKQQKQFVDRFVNKCSKVVTVSDEYSRHLNMPHEKYRGVCSCYFRRNNDIVGCTSSNTVSRVSM